MMACHAQAIAIKRTWPEYNKAAFLIKYQMLSILESLKIMLSE